MKHLVLGHARDAHAQHVLAQLTLRGHDAMLVETHKFPLSVALSVYPGSNSGDLTIDGVTVELGDIGSVYWRNFCGVTAETTRANRGSATDIAHFDSMACLRSWFQMKNGTRWCNSWDAYQMHQEKPRQLEVVAQTGVTIPETYIGNNADKIIAFCSRVDSVIFKPVYGGAHTQRVTAAHLNPEHLRAALAQSPVTLQRMIEGTNIRTYVIGDQIFSAELPTEEVDFRSDTASRPVAIDTPAAIARQSRGIREVLGMEWTAIDWRRDADGQYFFLEANPSPMFMGFEKMCGYPLTEALLDLMTGSSAAATSQPPNVANELAMNAPA